MLFHFCLKLKKATHFMLTDTIKPSATTIIRKYSLPGIDVKSRRILPKRTYSKTVQVKSSRLFFWYKISLFQTTNVAIKNAANKPRFIKNNRSTTSTFLINWVPPNTKSNERIANDTTVVSMPVTKIFHSNSIRFSLSAISTRAL